MSYDYDALYATEPHALGAQTKSIAAFVAGLDLTCAHILDVGCGQGRDALPLARAGHSVTGVDLSPSGVAAMLAEAAAEGLTVTGHVADITTFTPRHAYDVLLIDRTLHMLAADPRATVFASLITCLAPNGWLVLADEKANLPAFLRALEDDKRNWTVERCSKGLLFAQVSGD